MALEAGAAEGGEKAVEGEAASTAASAPWRAALQRRGFVEGLKKIFQSSDVDSCRATTVEASATEAKNSDIHWSVACS